MIYINDKAHPYEQERSLSELFQHLNMDISKGVAVALNNKVIPRSEWGMNTVSKNDKIILIKATQGG